MTFERLGRWLDRMFAPRQGRAYAVVSEPLNEALLYGAADAAKRASDWRVPMVFGEMGR